MQARSAVWKQIARSTSFRCESIAEIDGVTYASISAPVIERGLFPESLSIGNCVSSSLQLSIRGGSDIAHAASITIKNRIVAENDSAQSEYLPAGTFWVSRRSYDVVNRLTTLTCYDAMLKANAAYPVGAAANWPKSQQAVVTEIAGLLGVQVDARTSISASAPAIAKPAGYTIRDVLGFIGVANCGNWIITKDNKLRLVPIASAPAAVDLAADNYIDLYGVVGRLTTGRSLTVSGVILTNDQNEGEAYTAGNDNGYVLNCTAPFASQELCNTIFTTIGGLVYHPYTANKGVYDLAAELGDPIVRLTDRSIPVADPGAQIDILSYLCRETATYGFAFRGDISAPTSAELEDEYPYLGSRGQKGEDGRSIVGQLVTYAQSDSASADPADLTWSTIIPQVDPGDYLWTRTTFYYSSDPYEEHTYTVSLQGSTGVGIASEREYYTVTDSGTVTPDDPETDPTIWTADIPPLRDAGEYLWRCHETTYTDNSVVYTSPVCVTGDPGDQGTDGERGTGIWKITTAPSSYTTQVGDFTPKYRVALSTVLSQSGANEIIVGDIIERSYNHYAVGYVDSTYVYLGAATSIRGSQGPAGTSVTIKSVVKENGETVIVLTDSSGDTTLTISDGEDGDNGHPGLSGYVHLAWANSADGTVGFSTSSAAGKTYLGSYTDNTATDSSRPQDYNWARIQGPQGEPGSDGDDGVGIASERDYFTITDSDSDVPDDPETDPTIWTADTPPSRDAGEYIWRCHETTYTDNSTAYSTPVCITGDPGDQGSQGVGIASERDYFTITNSDSEVPDDPETDPTIWTADSPPQRGYKEYIWRCHETTYTDGSVAYATPVCITGDPGDSGLTLIISSDKGSAFNYDAFAELTGDIYDAAGNLVDPDGEDFIIRWWFTQDGKAARYLNGGKSLVIAVNDSLCDYMSDIWFETIPIEESVFPFLLCKRDGTILTSRRGFPLSVAAAERYGQ